MDAATARRQLLSPIRLGPVTLPNRMIKAATYEGMARLGRPTPELAEFHRRFAAGGIGTTTVAYCAVSPEGRTFRHQLLMRREFGADFARVTDAVHAEGAAAAIQLGHAGGFADPHATHEAAIAPSRVFNAHGLSFPRPFRDADFVRVGDAFADAARLAADAGFDLVEIHLGHGYLLSQFLTPATNRRRDRWGGDIEGRARFPREVLAKVRDAVGDRVAISAKLNLDDGFAGGLQVHESVQVARWLETDGSVDAIQLSGGSTSKTPMYLMRGDVPLRELIEDEHAWYRKLGMRAVAPMILKQHAFDEAFFAPLARQVRAEVSLPLMLLGGITRAETMQQAMADGFEFVAMARAVLREPDLPKRIAAGEADRESLCTHCNRCVVTMNRGGTHCVFDAAPVLLAAPTRRAPEHAEGVAR